MSNGRAKRGGQIGQNGEHYAGGQFLPSTEQGKKGKASRKPGKRGQVAPGVWEVAPSGDYAPLYASFSALVHPDTLEPLALDWSRYDLPATLARVAAYRAGKKWRHPETEETI